MFDPRERAIAEHLSPLHERALRRPRLAELLIARRDALERTGYESGVRAARPARSFTRRARAPRCRLAPAEAGFVELGTQNALAGAADGGAGAIRA